MLLIILSFLISVAQAQTIKVAVIDTGFDMNSKWPDAPKMGLSVPKICKEGHNGFKTKSVEDKNGHGTHVAGLIAKFAEDSDYCLVILKYYTENNFILNQENSNSAIKEATRQKVDVINYSGGGKGRDDEECELVKKALDKGIVFIAAAGNNGLDLEKKEFYPALCDKRVVIVENVNSNGSLQNNSNYFKGTDRIVMRELGGGVMSIFPNNSFRSLSGTSQATAIVTGKFVKTLHLSNKNRKK